MITQAEYDDCSGKRFCKLGITRFFYYIGFVFISGSPCGIFTGIDSGMTLSTSYVDEATNYSNGTPIKNWYSGYRGRQTIRTAIKDSMNIITVKCFQEVTPQVGYDLFSVRFPVLGPRPPQIAFT